MQSVFFKNLAFAQEDVDPSFSMEDSDATFDESSPTPSENSYGGMGRPDEVSGGAFGGGKENRNYMGGAGRAKQKGKVEFRLVNPGNPRYGNKNLIERSEVDSFSYDE